MKKVPEEWTPQSLENDVNGGGSIGSNPVSVSLTLQLLRCHDLVQVYYSRAGISSGIGAGYPDRVQRELRWF